MSYKQPSDWDEQDWADEDDDDNDDRTITCPECQAEIYEDSERCPECGHYLSSSERYGDRRPAWVVITAALLLLWILYALIGGLLKSGW